MNDEPSFLKKNLVYIIFVMVLLLFYVNKSCDNRIQILENALFSSWSKVDAQLQRRYTSYLTISSKSTIRDDSEKAVLRLSTQLNPKNHIADNVRLVEKLETILAKQLTADDPRKGTYAPLSKSLVLVLKEVAEFNHHVDRLNDVRSRPLFRFFSNTSQAQYPKLTVFESHDIATLNGFSHVSEVVSDD